MNPQLLPDIAEGITRRHANSGGPMSRTRKERIRSSLLGSDDGVIRCPRRISLWLSFSPDPHAHLVWPGDSAEVRREKRQRRKEYKLTPVEFVLTRLKREGLRDPEELRKRYFLPQGKLFCGPWTGVAEPLVVYDASSYDVLEQALMLGLCTAQIFDPGRPVIWTDASLTRRVELFDPGSFYA